jgi:hypothetical protein
MIIKSMGNRVRFDVAQKAKSSVARVFGRFPLIVCGISDFIELH